MSISNIDLLLLSAMTASSVWTVMTRSLVKSAIGLALTSSILSVIIFRLDSPMAAVFELSVCTGLITVVFLSTISLIKPLTHREIMELSKKRYKRFWYMPFVILGLAAFIAIFVRIPNQIPAHRPWLITDVRVVLWNLRHLDLFGQIIVLLAGALGVVVLFEERKKDEW